MKSLLLLTLIRQTTAWCTAEGCQNEYEKPLADYTKYPEGDTYASACYAKFELHHTEPYLYVRGNSHSYDSKPTDHFADSGICGAREMGDRVTYLRFDVRDLSEDAVASAELRLTPDGFPANMVVVVEPGCDSSRPEDAVAWDVQPSGGHERCRWTGDPDLLWDGNPRSCDVTHDLRIAARAGDYFCVRLRGDPDANSRGDLYGAARFFSRDADENSLKSWWADFDPSSVFTMRGSMIGTPHALAPHLRINATQCGSVYPDKHGPGNCGPDWGAATDELFRTARPTPRPSSPPTIRPTPAPTTPRPSVSPVPTFETGAPTPKPT